MKKQIRYYGQAVAYMRGGRTRRLVLVTECSDYRKYGSIKRKVWVPHGSPRPSSAQRFSNPCSHRLDQPRLQAYSRHASEEKVWTEHDSPNQLDGWRHITDQNSSRTTGNEAVVGCPVTLSQERLVFVLFVWLHLNKSNKCVRAVVFTVKPVVLWHARCFCLRSWLRCL